MTKRKYHLHLRGRVGYYDFNAEFVEWVLKKHENEQVNVLINSTGGDLFTAMTISAAFRRHGNVHVHYEAMNASAATIASLGAKRVTIDSKAMYLVHKCSQQFFLWSGLNADQLKSLIENLSKAKDDLDKIDLNIARGYAERCKKTKDELLALMKKGGWLTAEEALQWGFVDEVTDYPEDVQAMLTPEVAAELESAGVPLPDMPLQPEKESEKGILARIREFLNKHYNYEPPNKEEENMKKEIFAVLALTLGLATLECEEKGSVSLTCEQLKKLDDTVKKLQEEVKAKEDELKTKNDELKTKNDEIAALKGDAGKKETKSPLQARIDALQKEIDALKKAPGDDTTSVTETKKEEPEADDTANYFNEMKAAKETLDLLK